jgi:hypothetical protein
MVALISADSKTGDRTTFKSKTPEVGSGSANRTRIKVDPSTVFQPAVSLMTAAIVQWYTVYLDRAVWCIR